MNTETPKETADEKPAGMTGFERIRAERKRQVDVEKISAHHDATVHPNGELSQAARSYDWAAQTFVKTGRICVTPPPTWPWEPRWWKISEDPVRMWEKAGALYLAESERLGNSSVWHEKAVVCGEKIDIYLWSEHAKRAESWRETAERAERDREYYRGLVVQMGELFGEEARRQDDGGLSECVLCAKVPELVVDLVQRFENLAAAGIHSCSDSCQKPLCVARRELERLESVIKSDSASVLTITEQWKVCEAERNALRAQVAALVTTGDFYRDQAHKDYYAEANARWDAAKQGVQAPVSTSSGDDAIATGGAE